MKVIEILRIEENQQYGTFGILRINKEAFCVTLEPADQLNAPFVSSIPAQQYICELHQSPKFGFTYMITDVPERTNVLFHPGNSIHDTEGCVLTGSSFEKFQGNRIVSNSGRTFKRFMKALEPNAKVHLTVKEIY